MPLVDDVPIDEKVRRANVVLKTRPRDAEETLLQLINDDDQIVAAAAIDLVEERKLWTLANDHRVRARAPGRERLVRVRSRLLGTRSATASQRTERRGLWIEPLPVVQLAARLRHMPVFASVSVAELFRIAGSGRQIRYESGRILYQEGAVPEQLQFMLDGTVTAKADGEDARDIVPPASLGFEQILEGSAMPETIRTAETTVCLAVTRDELRTLISTNADLVEGLFRMLVGGPQAADRLVMKSHAAAEAAHLPARPLKPIERILVLEKVPVFAEIGPERDGASGVDCARSAVGRGRNAVHGVGHASRLGGTGRAHLVGVGGRRTAHHHRGGRRRGRVRDAGRGRQRTTRRRRRRGPRVAHRTRGVVRADGTAAGAAAAAVRRVVPGPSGTNGRGGDRVAVV